jgi:hypothetical protein
MIGPIERFMTEDHIRIDGLMRRATAGAEIDVAAFEDFREALLRHIGMEEKILVPLLRDRGTPFEHATRLRREHGEIARLLVPTPTRELCDRVCEMLARHNPIEEGPRGLYSACDEAARDAAGDVIERLRAAPRVPLARHYDGPLVHGKPS